MAPPPPPSWGVFLCGQTNSGTRRPFEIFKKRKMFRIEFPKVLAWFQTPLTVSRPSRPNFQPRKDQNSSGWNPSCFLCGYTSNAARGKRLQGRSLFWTNQGLIMASSWILFETPTVLAAHWTSKDALSQTWDQTPNSVIWIWEKEKKLKGRQLYFKSIFCLKGMQLLS